MAESQEVSGSRAVPMCANGCGFFGSAATKNLCSKCYNEHLIKTADAGVPVAEKKIGIAKAAAHVSESKQLATATPVAHAPAEKVNGGGPVETKKQEASVAGGAVECANGCGFFGSAGTKSMCSGCYRDFLRNVRGAPALADKVVLAPEQQPAALQISAASSTAAPAVEAAPAVKAAAPNRCALCRKKVGLLGLPCRCGATFCALHLHPEKHGCDFDFKTADREKIAKNNPLIMAAKINKV